MIERRTHSLKIQNKSSRGQQSYLLQFSVCLIVKKQNFCIVRMLWHSQLGWFLQGDKINSASQPYNDVIDYMCKTCKAKSNIGSLDSWLYRTRSLH